jgi:AAA+ ATPase superfamily predicted ATPase
MSKRRSEIMAWLREGGSMSKRRSEIMAWLREEARVCEAAEDPNEECYEMLHEAANEIEALVREVKRLRKALGFYALVENWEADIGLTPNAIHDKGHLARSALEEGA